MAAWIAFSTVIIGFSSVLMICLGIPLKSQVRIFRLPAWQRARRQRKGKRAFRRDMAQVKQFICCGSCRGTATELGRNSICKDRELCRTMLIYEAMLDSTA